MGNARNQGFPKAEPGGRGPLPASPPRSGSGFEQRWGNRLERPRQAAVFKATHKMAYADCFAAALAKRHKAQLVTGDPEFEQVEKEIKIGWLK